ncbi:MAG: diaminopimelate epimerase [Campylobacterales bacterium]|nr:diaminopimelate epimerase [Campylobacterales bacterium]
MHVSKYSASGNDFVIFHTLVKQNRSALARQLCDRHEGVGADGMIVLVPHERCDFEWEFYNNDGSQPAMCGNGSRACAHYALANGLAPASMRFMSGAGEIGAVVEGSMVESELTPASEVAAPFEAGGARWFFFDTGVPHVVTFDLPFDLALAKTMRETYNANVNFCTYENALHVRTYERGVEGETQACGTGMVAAFLSVYRYHDGPACLEVIPTSGERLQVRINGETLFLKGAVKPVFTAQVQGV